MASIFKSIAATQFLSNMLSPFLWTVTYLNFTPVAQYTSEKRYSIATFSENVKNHKYLENCNR